MSSIQRGFSEETLSVLLRALQARSSGHPDNPGLVASWPGVRETDMDRACTELKRRGHPVFRASIAGRTRDGWAIRNMREGSSWQA